MLDSFASFCFPFKASLMPCNYLKLSFPLTIIHELQRIYSSNIVGLRIHQEHSMPTERSKTQSLKRATDFFQALFREKKILFISLSFPQKWSKCFKKGHLILWKAFCLGVVIKPLGNNALLLKYMEQSCPLRVGLDWNEINWLLQRAKIWLIKAQNLRCSGLSPLVLSDFIR